MTSASKNVVGQYDKAVLADLAPQYASIVYVCYRYKTSSARDIPMATPKQQHFLV